MVKKRFEKYKHNICIINMYILIGEPSSKTKYNYNKR